MGIGSFLQDFLLLAMRLFWGISFFLAGWPKLMDIDRVASSFESIGILLPMLNAYLVGTFEAVGGLLLLLGFASRFVSIPLAITMFVALLTAHGTSSFEAYSAFMNIHNNFPEFIEKAQKVTKEEPFLYLLTCIIVFCFGPGNISIDYLLAKIFNRSSRKR
jgi:putative oxidoreductase